jgi:hypothetical protein
MDRLSLPGHCPGYFLLNILLFSMTASLSLFVLAWMKSATGVTKPRLNMQLHAHSSLDASTFASDPLTRLLDLVLVSQDRKLVVHCRGGCRGIADRIRGILFASTIAYLSGRQLVLDRSLLSYVPTPPEGPHYWFQDRCSTPEVAGHTRHLLVDASPTVFITSSCFNLPAWGDLVKDRDDNAKLQILDDISRQCSQQQEDAYRCGAAAFRAALPHVKEFRDGFNHAQDLLHALQPSLPTENYTVIQIRAGGSSIDVDGTSVPALSWPDDYDSDLPNHWIRAFQSFGYSDCKRSVAVISDSARVLSEIWQAARDKLMVVHCCSQPLHRDRARSRPDEFYLQEVFDLSLMAGAKRIIAGNGNFATLGRYWVETDGPTLVRAKSQQAIHDVFLRLLNECECRNIAAPSEK